MIEWESRHSHSLVSDSSIPVLSSIPVSATPAYSSSWASAAATAEDDASSSCVSIRQHTSAYVSIRQHTSAYVSIRQHASAYVSIRQDMSGYVSISQHTSAYVSILFFVSMNWCYYGRSCLLITINCLCVCVLWYNVIMFFLFISHIPHTRRDRGIHRSRQNCVGTCATPWPCVCVLEFVARHFHIEVPGECRILRYGLMRNDTLPVSPLKWCCYLSISLIAFFLPQIAFFFLQGEHPGVGGGTGHWQRAQAEFLKL